MDLLLTTLKTLKQLQDNMGIRLGVAGSVAKGTYTEKSDIDIVADTDMLTLEQLDYIESFFKNSIDIIQLPLLKEEDIILDNNMIELGLPINEFSAYKTIVKEVIWCE